MSDDVTPPLFITTQDGETYGAEALARKLKGSIVELGDTPGLDEESAIAALAGFATAENIGNLMDDESLENFVDEFVNAWMED